MGGIGSGNRYRWGTKAAVEACRSIDVRRWQREGRLQPDTSFTWVWTRDNEEIASIGVFVGLDTITLRYIVNPNGEQVQKIEYTVPLTWTPCRYGGRRPWFLCPGMVNDRPCGRRVAKLYDRGTYLLCRHCYDLTYQSRRESSADRGRIRAQAIRVQLGGTANLMMPFPLKPKGMHWRTYERLRWQADLGEEKFWLRVRAWLDRQQDRDAAIRAPRLTSVRVASSPREDCRSGGLVQRRAGRLGELTYDQKRMALDALGARVTVWRADHEPRYRIEANIPLGELIVSRTARSSSPESRLRPRRAGGRGR